MKKQSKSIAHNIWFMPTQFEWVQLSKLLKHMVAWAQTIDWTVYDSRNYALRCIIFMDAMWIFQIHIFFSQPERCFKLLPTLAIDLKPITLNCWFIFCTDLSEMSSGNLKKNDTHSQNWISKQEIRSQVYDKHMFAI